MTYATQQDLIDRYGIDEVVTLADRDGNGVMDPSTVARALADVDAEIDSYLSIRYAVPITPTPHVLKRVSVDMAMYRLSLAHQVTEERETRYRDAVALLRALGSGKASLGIATDDDQPEAAGESTAAAWSTPRRVRPARS